MEDMPIYIPMMIDKITPFVDLNYELIKVFELTNTIIT